MANFQPSGKILIGRVPFDNSYRHTLTFSSVSEQTSFMMGRMDSSLEKDTYTYVRMNNSIRVMFNAERLYTYDYVMYQNLNYGSKWFYAFIVGVNYVNENCTELVLELDVMQTWYFDYTLKQCFVEREHVTDDTVGAHLNEEPAMPLQYQRLGFTAHTFEAKYAVLLLNAYMHKVDSTGDAVNGVDAVTGVWAQNQYNACRYAIYKLDVPESRQRLGLDVQSLNQHGAADTIADAFVLPENAIDPDDLVLFPQKTGDNWGTVTNYVWTLVDGAEIADTYRSLSKPTTLGDYTPRNKKLLCYPYSYIEIGDFTGRTEDLRWEYFSTDSAVLRQELTASSDCQGYVTPQAYNGLPNTTGAKTFKPFTFDFQNKISWVYSTYQNWAAQNALNNQLAILGGVGAMAFSFLPGISAAGKMLGAGAAQMEHLGGLGLGQASQNAMMSYSNAAAREFGATKPNMGALGGGLAAIASTLGNIDRMRKHPNTANGNTSGNSKWQIGYSGWYDAKVCLLPEYAAIVDDFLDMYGYQVDRVKVPNRTGRPYWNYIKCQNSCHVGNVPSDMMNQINKIYDAGITFWHTSDVGNYSLNNH